jgi:hypothetical protein
MIVTRPVPLQQINAFDAAARHLSFSRAAQEMNVQQRGRVRLSAESPFKRLGWCLSSIDIRQ